MAKLSQGMARFIGWFLIVLGLMFSAWTWNFFADGQLWFRIVSTLVAFGVGVGFGVIVILVRWPTWGQPDE